MDIQQYSEISGLTVPGGSEEKHSLSSIVDDSTVFLQKAQHLPRVLNKVKQFGRMQVQPTKNKIILLNTAVDTMDFHGILVLRHRDTASYLGYAVGTGELAT